MVGRLFLALPAALLALATPTAAGVVSPGALSRAHAELEGTGNCKRCHDEADPSFARPCLACHRALRQRIDADAGYHATLKRSGQLETCGGCHVEHQGRDFPLVEFAGGEQKFDHRDAGYLLDGKHATLACRDCHRPKLHRTTWTNDDAVARDRTWLGLRTACRDCHEDPHAGQFDNRTCDGCHTTEDWRGLKDFDHAATRYPLLGRHSHVACGDCHRAARDAAGRSVTRFAPLPFGNCDDCHNDPHRAGNAWRDCDACHDVSTPLRDTTLSIARHGETAYPLVGRHRGSECRACHRGADYAARHPRVDGDDCAACHGRNVHEVSSERPALPPCRDCHTTATFAPATYTRDQHAQARFPLQGAHALTPCGACHREGPRPAALPVLAPATKVVALHPPGRDDCAACHRNVHADQFDVRSTPRGCAGCHDTRRWRDVRFDHEPTGFSLAGAHAEVGCRRCHEHGTATAGDHVARRVPVRGCVDCHDDPHFGQFAGGPVPRDCRDCHGVDRFTFAPGTWNHANRTDWPLSGGHERVRCDACHLDVAAAGRTAVRWRGTPRDCSACHVDPHAMGDGP